jgi:hypothetical protein
MSGVEKKRRWHPLLWLALLAFILLLVAGSTFWHRATRVQLDLATTRLAFTPGGEEPHEILNRSVPFSSLVIEDCGTVAFAAETLEVADPRQLVPGTRAGETPRFPAEAWRKLTLTDPVTLLCDDPSAKLTLNNPGPAGARPWVLDRIPLAPGSQVVLEISPGREPALSLEIETPQKLSFVVGPDLEIVTDFIKPEGITVPFPGDLLTWRARLPESRRSLEITSGEHGMVLIVTPTQDQAAQLFREPLDLPLASVETLEENLEGTLTSPLRDNVTLSYPDYPGIPAVTIEKDEAVGLGGLSQARLRSLTFDAGKGALRARFDGVVKHAASRSGELPANDHRLTLYHTFRYSWRWRLIGMVAVGIASAALAAFEIWNKLRE